MRHRSRIVGLAVAAGAALPAPAHAAPLGTVSVQAKFVSVPVGDRVTTVAVCTAVAVGTEPEVVAVATEVDCSVDGVERSAALPGSLAVTAQTSTALPLSVCVAGRAAFLDTATNNVFNVAATPACVPVG
jgi:hypothetical protein